MLIRAIDYVAAGSLEHAVAALRERPPGRVLAGGQSLLNALKHRLVECELLVDVGRLDELRFIDVRTDGSVEIGAATTYDELDRSTDLRAVHPAVCETAAHVGDQQVRCQGTIGGNVCQNDPVSNFPPLLVALEAVMHVFGPGGSREVPAEEFFSVALGAGEVLRSVSIPALCAGDGIGLSSVQVAEDSWAIARAAAYVRSNGRVDDARVVLGCVGPRPVRARAVEQRLRGGPARADAVRAAAESAAEGIDPPSDASGSADYRRALARVVVERAIQQAISNGGRS